MIRLSLLVVVMLTSIQLFAQVAKPLQFREETFDFGRIAEEAGAVTHEFIFTNVSGRPVKILNVRPSCGCTTPDWTKDAILPGKTGFIQARFDPAGRPGFFNKTLSVTTDYDGGTVVLQIKGQVTSGNGVVPTEFTVAQGNLRFRSRALQMGKVFIKDEYLVKEFEFINSGSEAITFTGKTDAPVHIRVQVEPSKVEPGASGVIKLAYNGKLKNAYGFHSDNVALYTDDDLQPVKSFSVPATLEDYFPVLSAAELAAAPRLQLSSGTVDFGRIKQHSTTTQVVTVMNAGKSTLELRSLQGNCTCVKAKAGKTVLKPGESTPIEITFNPFDRKATQQKAVTIYSNDPQSPVQRVLLTGYVE